jgi:hypothetical protein
MTNDEKILAELRQHVDNEGRVKCSFAALSDKLGIEKEELDLIFNDLEKKRYIDQFVLPGRDEFGVRLQSDVGSKF